jgi:hypothetical protein
VPNRRRSSLKVYRSQSLGEVSAVEQVVAEHGHEHGHVTEHVVAPAMVDRQVPAWTRLALPGYRAGPLGSVGKRHNRSHSASQPSEPFDR